MWYILLVQYTTNTSTTYSSVCSIHTNTNTMSVYVIPISPLTQPVGVLVYWCITEMHTTDV